MKFLIALILAYSVLISCNKVETASSGSRPIELGVVTLTSRSVLVPQEYICEINASQFVEVRARVQGYLEEIFIDEGQTVKKGQSLFRLSSHEYREAVTRAEANLRRAIAEAKTRSLETDRIGVMVKKNVISAIELEVATAQKEAAESGVLEAKSVLENARINLGYTLIKAPFDGIIDRLPFKKGSLINTGALLTSISDISEVYAYFRVSEKEYLQFAKSESKEKEQQSIHQPVKLVLADGTEYPLQGVIETVEGDFERSTGSIAFRAHFSNPKKLIKHGSTGKILLEKKWNDALLIPQESAFTIQDKYFVFVLDSSNKARSKNFNTIERYRDYFITTGLKSGDRIVTEGIQQLRDGMSVLPKNEHIDSTALTSRLN